tara:strand:- start:6946 stop:7788 length:843 start_codon:yes stop_codon:yes gene_type:complete
MILIVESGSTKADWVLLDGITSKSSFQTKGWNPLFLSSEQMMLRLKSYSELNTVFTKILEVHFYTPGCSNPSSFNILESSLKSVFVEAKIMIKSDLCAAARSAYKGSPLFVSILGTGSNTAFYNGDSIDQLKPSLGYVMGDEGSGASLGRLLLRSYLYQNLPANLHLEFSKKHSISKELVLNSVYKEDHPNQFLASYVPFLVMHKTHPYVKDLVQKEFKCYLETHVLSHPLCCDYSISFVGSVAFYFQDIIKDLCVENNLDVSKFIRFPIDSLINYHTKK